MVMASNSIHATYVHSMSKLKSINIFAWLRQVIIKLISFSLILLWCTLLIYDYFCFVISLNSLFKLCSVLFDLFIFSIMYDFVISYITANKRIIIIFIYSFILFSFDQQAFTK